MTANWSQETYIKAWDFATLAHQGQTYGGPEEGQRIDYINHVGAVTMEVVWALCQTPGANGDLALQCALLHDVIEDTAFTHADITDHFSKPVADGVLALTKDERLPDKATQMADSLERIRAQPREVWMVKLADRITNLSEPPFHWDNDKKRRYQAEAQMIHDALHTAHDALGHRLAEKIRTYPEYMLTE